MATEENLESMIVQNVLKELAKNGFLQNVKTASVPQVSETPTHRSIVNDADEYIELPPIGKILIHEPIHKETVAALKAMTPARIGVGRAGPRYRTTTLLHYLADHSQAQDAVFLDVSDEFLQRMGIFEVQTQVSDREEHLTRPDLGCRLSKEAREKISANCKKNVQVQVFVADGLSSKAIESNVAELLPALIQGLQGEGILDIGTPFFVKYGRVRVEDEIGILLNAEVVVELVGERPGLGTANSLSAYIIYKPTEKTVEADRTVVSNIHMGGTPPVEAGAFLAGLIKDILKAKTSGIKLTTG
ncbi:MAG: ethanolamine ammonia-lyase subunit EutC [Eubacteriales bacterium]